MKAFDIPSFYKSPIISRIKEIRKSQDPKKKNFTPTFLDFGNVRFNVARHFGFCYGVENAIEISYRALQENPTKKIFLLSQMIHNPDVNADLLSRGIQFLMDTSGNEMYDMNKLTAEDIVIIPAFGTTLEVEAFLKKKEIETHRYNTTCPFVERVWKKSEKLGAEKYTIVIHGKHRHEETRATFSHSKANAPAVVIKDINDARKLAAIIKGEEDKSKFYTYFANCFSENFNVETDLQRIGVVNQTTMLATETQEIADFLKNVMIEKYGEENYKNHFADTRDTLCYATNDNQDATYGLLEGQADLAIVVGGYNSSNTSHLAELLEKKFPTYYISSEREIISAEEINHFDYHTGNHITTRKYLPEKRPLTIALTSGASCPDAVVEQVINKILAYCGSDRAVDEVLQELSLAYA